MIALSQCPGIDPVKDSSAALQAALNLKQPVTVDCPVNFIMGTDPTKGIFVPDGSDVTFTPRGRFDVDSVGFPALCFYHTMGIWRGTKIRYTGNFGRDGIATTQPIGGAWNSVQAKRYLVTQGLNDYSAAPSYAGAYWTGPTNACALISLKGSANVQFFGGKVYVDEDVSASQFAPVACAMDQAYATPGVAPSTTLVQPTASFEDFEIDGAYMGFVGGGYASFKNITRRRYSDLQAADGSFVGGVNAWMAPPHFFYMQGPAKAITTKIRNAVDLGQFVGNPLRRLSTSGSSLSLKVELAGCDIDGYYSRCLDGGMDILANTSANAGKIRNAFFMIDTSILTIDGKPAAWGARFPSAHPYSPGSVTASIMNLANEPVPILRPPAAITCNWTCEQGYGVAA